MTNAYDRDLLRSQIGRLREAAAMRARLETEIAAEHRQETGRTRTEAEATLAAATKKFTAAIEATKREYAAALQKTADLAASEQKKLDDQRQALTASLTKTAEKEAHQAREDDLFEAGSAREVFKEKRKDPARLFAKSERDIARVATQVAECTTRTAEFLAARGVTGAGPAAETGSEPQAFGGDVLATLETVSGTAAVSIGGGKGPGNPRPPRGEAGVRRWTDGRRHDSAHAPRPRRRSGDLVRGAW